MHAVAMVVMILGIVGFALNFASVIAFGSMTLWGGLAVGGMLVTIMTRRPSN